MKLKIIEGTFGYINCISLGKEVVVLEYSIETPEGDESLTLEGILEEYFGNNLMLHVVDGANIWYHE